MCTLYMHDRLCISNGSNPNIVVVGRNAESQTHHNAYMTLYIMEVALLPLLEVGSYPRQVYFYTR